MNKRRTITDIDAPTAAVIAGTFAFGPIVPVVAVSALGVGLAAEGAWKLTKRMFRKDPFSRPKPPRVIYVEVPPQRDAQVRDLIAAYERARELLKGLPCDEQPIAEENLRLDYLRQMEELK